MSGRKPRADELELWRQVARQAKPLSELGNKAQDIPPEVKKHPPRPQTPVPENFTIGERHPSRNETHLPPGSVSERLRNAPVQMDSKAFGRLKRGKLKPEARIDLHGMTVEQAHGALTRFILQSANADKRLVLVITGKGVKEDPYAPLPIRRGVLKQQVPQWLRMAPLAGMVLQVSEAHNRHGGAGAYYVYLRRNR